MDVEPRPLPTSPMIGLQSLETRPQLDIFSGEVLGYWCPDCGHSDESLEQIVHCTDCEHHGRHGRQVYDGRLQEVLSMDSTGELRTDTQFTKLVWGTTDSSFGIVHDEVVAFRCEECGNMDETIFEIVHDSACRLAGDTFGATLP